MKASGKVANNGSWGERGCSSLDAACGCVAGMQEGCGHHQGQTCLLLVLLPFTLLPIHSESSSLIWGKWPSQTGDKRSF